MKASRDPAARRPEMVRERHVEPFDPAVGQTDIQPVDAVLDVREGHPATVEEGQAGLARTPSGGTRCPGPARPSRSVPVAAVQRYRLQNPVRSPLNHSEPSGAHAAWQIDSRDSEPATTVRRPPRSTIKPGGIPRHVRVVPLQPAEGRAVRAPARIGDEVGAADHHLGHRGSRGGETHDRVDRLAAVAGCSSWTHSSVDPSGETSPSAWRRPAGDRRLGGQRDGRAAGADAVQPLRRPVGEPQHAARRPTTRRRRTRARRCGRSTARRAPR